VILRFTTFSGLIESWKGEKRDLFQVSRNMAFQLLSISKAEVASAFDAAGGLSEHVLDWGESALVKRRTVICLRMLEKFLFVVCKMATGIAEPLHPVTLFFVFVPFLFAVEEMNMEFAISISTDVRLEIFEDVFPMI
jgi:hypothetical protein